MKGVKNDVSVPARSKFYQVKKNFARNWQIYVFLLPAVAYFIILHYIPMYGVQIAFKNFFANLGIWGVLG